MKKFTNTQTEITTTDEAGEVIRLGYADLAALSLNAAPKDGWTTDEMRKRIRVTDKLKELSLDQGTELEDADFAKILECSKIAWTFMHKDIVAYEDHLLEMDKS